MMKNIVVIILSLMMLGASAYASPISQKWLQTYGGTDEDSITCIQQTMDGGYIAAGHTRSFAPGLYIYIMVIKLDANGNVSWQKTYHYGTWISNASTIQQTSDGGYILAGFTTLPSNVTGWILKLASNGDIVWQKVYNEIIEFRSLKQTAEGGYIAVGDTSVLRLNSDGSVLWQRRIGGLDYLSLNDIQQAPDGSYIVTGHHYNYDYDILVLKMDTNGNLLWQKTYRGSVAEIPHSIQIMPEGGYIVAASSASNALVFRIDENGTIVWQKRPFGGLGEDVVHHIKKQTGYDRYIMLGSTNSFGSGDSDMWLLAISSSTGSMVWQIMYGGEDDDYGFFFNETIDGGYVIAGNTRSFDVDGQSLMILKLDGDGAIPPGCDIIGLTDSYYLFNATVIEEDISVFVESTISPVTATDAITEDISVETSVVCYYEDPDDMDGDGIENVFGSSMESSMFLDSNDNCPDTPNGPFLGTCITGDTHKVGRLCIEDTYCGTGGFCSMNQEDTNGSGMGDACYLCEADFDCDGDCDGTDAAEFKLDFGRSSFLNPCINEDQCHGDFDCDGDCDGTDAAGFKVDFGRSSFNNSCPACEVGDWCVYP